jgi:3'-phosphoadenosine 5'-phosphosulfate (PAPS) 3'-phosphatase
MPEGGSDYVWVLDPIDGTKSFITGDYNSFYISVNLIQCLPAFLVAL